MNQPENSGHIGADQLVPGIRFSVNNIAGNVNTGIRQQDIDPAKLADRLFHDKFDIFRAGHVGRHNDGLRIKVFCQSGQPILGTRRQNLFHAVPGQLVGDRATDTGAGARDDSHFVLERLIHGGLCS